jgi:xylulokinase
VAETYREAGAAPSRVLAVGGGTKNAIWMQATSDIAGLPQEVCARTTGAAYGDAFLARVALGQAEVADIATWNPVERRVEPVPSEALARAYSLWRRLYEQTKDIARELG